MAIIRQRLPIPGPFDIRIGLPRDKGFDPAATRKRIGQINREELARQQREGDFDEDAVLNRIARTRPQRQTRINRFVSMMKQAGGFFRPNRYLVEINLPSSLRQATTGAGTEFIQYETQFANASATKDELKDRLIFFCESARIAEKSLEDVSAESFYGPNRKVASDVAFGPLDMSFYLDSNLSERVFFEQWQSLAYNQATYNMNFYDDYTGSIKIWPLIHLKEPIYGDYESGSDGPLATATISPYYMEFKEVYPKTINAVDVGYGQNNSIAKQGVVFNYRLHETAADTFSVDNVNAEDYTEFAGTVKPGDFKPSLPTAEIGEIRDYKLPGEIRRARDKIIQVAKQRFPIGRIFGGRVFPPFF